MLGRIAGFNFVLSVMLLKETDHSRFKNMNDVLHCVPEISYLFVDRGCAFVIGEKMDKGLVRGRHHAFAAGVPTASEPNNLALLS